MLPWFEVEKLTNKHFPEWIKLKSLAQVPKLSEYGA